MESANFTPKKENSLFCNNCDFKCFKTSDLMRHISTAKHQRLINANGFAIGDNGNDIFIGVNIVLSIG